MRPLIDEVVLIGMSERMGLVLTTHRNRMHVQSFGSVDLVSLMLEEVASCGLARRSHPVLLILAAVCLLGSIWGIATGMDAVITLGLLAGIILGLGYISFREQILVVGSAGQSIRAQANGMSTLDLLAFIDAVEAAKNMRYLQGKQPVPPPTAAPSPSP